MTNQLIYAVFCNVRRFILSYPRTKNAPISFQKFCQHKFKFNKAQNYKVPSINSCPRCLMLLPVPLTLIQCIIQSKFSDAFWKCTSVYRRLLVMMKHKPIRDACEHSETLDIGTLGSAIFSTKVLY